MYGRFVIGILLLLLLFSPALSYAQQGTVAEALDILLSGGTLYSGAGEEPVVADLGIIGDRIAAIGDLSRREASQVFDVSGLAVVPGFIDIHSHAVRDDLTEGIFRWPDAENLIRQGVTTVIGGPDGRSPLPITDTFDAIKAKPASVNYATFVGHGSIRALVVGEDDRPPTEAPTCQRSLYARTRMHAHKHTRSGRHRHTSTSKHTHTNSRRSRKSYASCMQM